MKIERPAEGGDKQSQSAAKIKKLRKRLERLGDDITDCTERFKIERQIYDLEREATRDEWPDVINA